MTVRELATKTEDPPAPSPSGRKPPRALAARYRALFVIGRGGMGSVEAALEIDPSRPDADTEDASRPYERVVALKRLLPDGARDKRRAEMFLREARLAAMLEHPNVVSAYDYGELDGELFLAMEYVEGQPLSRVLRALADTNEQMPSHLVAHVLAEVCRGLHAAHELQDPQTQKPLQLVHRDVSPQNVMLGYDGRVRLLDFGVAKIETESVTKTGEVKGKTAYMSPEQAMGDTIDRRSDLFGVGSILFECLALRRMWGDGTDMDVIRKLALESPPKLEACGREAELPEGMSELHARLVARDAKHRPSTANEVAEALSRFVGDAEAAKRELRELLDHHFAEQAKEQRKRLTSSLHEVAPEQADELRESVLPPDALTPISVRARSAEATPAGAEVATPPPRAKSRSALPFMLAGLAVGALIAWRVASPASTEAAPAPTVGPSPSQSVTTTASTPPPSPGEAASAPPLRSAAAPTMTAPATTSATTRPTTTARTPPSATSATRVPTTTTPSSRPTTRPPDLDEKPF